MTNHDHADCHATYVPSIDETIHSLRDKCDWLGHEEALAEHGWCPVCQH